MVVEMALPGGVKTSHLLGLESIIGGEAAGVDEGGGKEGHMSCQEKQSRAHQGEHKVVISPQPAVLFCAIAEGVHDGCHCHHQQRQAIGEAVVPPAQSQRVTLHSTSHTEVHVYSCRKRWC